METVNMHPATKLILARIESNPEEFYAEGHGRWSNILDDLRVAATAEDWKLVASKLSEIHMDRVHKKIMEELCAPEQGILFKTKENKILTTAAMRQKALELFNSINTEAM